MLKSTLLKWLTDTATVTQVSDPSAHFRLVSLRSEAFKSRASTPGDKIRVVVGDAELRTYTPFDWDPAAGTARLLAYRRGEGVASRWLSGLRAGDNCQLLGPQRSTALDKLQRPAVFIGDETSFALAHAMQNTSGRSTDVNFLFEVSSIAESEPVLAAMGAGEHNLVERSADDAHLEILHRRLMDLLVAGAPRQFVFSGKSSTIQHLSRSLKRQGRSPAQLMVKAFWAPGKQALD
jgi:NADPH-dependent ferric siderophore reductase